LLNGFLNQFVKMCLEGISEQAEAMSELVAAESKLLSWVWFHSPVRKEEKFSMLQKFWEKTLQR